MQAGLARGLDEGLDVFSLQEFVQLPGDRDGVLEGGLAGVQVEQDKIRPIQIRYAREPDVERQRPLVDQVEQCLLVIDQDIVHSLALLCRQFRAGNPRGIIIGCILLPEMRRLGVAEPVGKALERGRPILQIGEQARRYAFVKVKDLPLGDSRIGKHDFVRMGDGDLLRFI